MEKWNAGVLILAGLVVGLVLGPILLSSPLPHPIAKPCPAQHQQKDCSVPKHDNFSIFLFMSQKHDAIEATASIAAVAAAVWLAIVTGYLWRSTRDLADSTRELASGAREQSDEIRKARELAEKEFELAEKHFLLADRQNNLADRQYGLERLRYLAEHKPKFEIRSIGIVWPTDADPRLTGNMVVVNTGDCEARIRESEWRFFWSINGLPMVPPLSPQHQTKPIFTEHPYLMLGHESLSVVLISDTPPTPEQIAQIQTSNMTWRLYLMGAIKFSDWDPEKERWMGFCRVFGAEHPRGEGRFSQTDNGDYEYSD